MTPDTREAELARARQLCLKVLAGELGLDELATAVRSSWELAEVAYGDLPPAADELAVVSWLYGTEQYALNGGDPRFRRAVEQMASGTVQLSTATPVASTPVLAQARKGTRWPLVGALVGAAGLVAAHQLTRDACSPQEVWASLGIAGACPRSGVVGLALWPVGGLLLLASLTVLSRRSGRIAAATVAALALGLAGGVGWQHHEAAVELRHRQAAQVRLQTLTLPAGVERSAEHEECAGSSAGLCAVSRRRPADLKDDVVRLLHGRVMGSPCPTSPRLRLTCSVLVHGEVAGYPVDAFLTDDIRSTKDGPLPAGAVPLRTDGKGPLYLVGSRLEIYLGLGA